MNTLDLLCCFFDVFGGFLQCEIHDLHRCEVYAPTSHGASATCEPFIFRGDDRAFSTTFFLGGQAVVSWNVASSNPPGCLA